MQFYSDPHQSRPMSLLIASVTLSLAVLCLLTLPLDIYNVSSSSPPSVIASHAQVVRVVLYLNFGLLLLFAFFFVPFTLFYYEVSRLDYLVFVCMCGDFCGAEHADNGRSVLGTIR